ncbi:MAG TPA: CoA-acylating methylmalonate-semialdehyde dehydrogenase [Candidatus Paceibacterota bacterium]|nr:CoA-acylating methylmalonate-semialdehyde dehydrogenase [Verrucomicrobiota bacterium]HRY51093.1 CoA-acylating methylmalonate-semialdehyde dehydrogenase [Candidatus Paceibacterota bacterium]
MAQRLLNYINGTWQTSGATDVLKVLNPASAVELAEVPLTPVPEVDQAVQAALRTFPDWRRTPAGKRIQPLFKLKALLEQNLDLLARAITDECGKTIAEAQGEMQRAIENVEVACGIPVLMQGRNNEDIAPGIDEHLIRQPLGVVAAITPFNFPGMIPFWFLPYAVATGNCFILKPSERVPMTSGKVFELIESAGFPAGVVQLVHGGRDTVNTLLDHPGIRAISFVGSTATARYVYSRASAAGKRAQCQGGAKNPVVIMPDADMEMTPRILADSAFGCAGQRCLAASVAILVGDARRSFIDPMVAMARHRKVGYGLDAGVEMGPVISSESKSRIETLIGKGIREGATVLADGRGSSVPGYENGFFVFPTILDGVPPRGDIARTEIFGPVLSLMRAATLDEAITLVNERSYGNMACIFTRDGAHARRFRYEVNAGNVGINVGVAAPMAHYPFSGWGDSFFGDLHAQAEHGVEFYTQTKIIVERWPSDWSRRF